MSIKNSEVVRHIPIENMIGKILVDTDTMDTDTMDTANSTCPSLEEIASFIDGNGSEQERNNIQVHLASCADCYAVFIETAKTIDELDSAENNVFGKRWYGITSAIAVAVVLLIAIGIFLKQPKPVDIDYSGQTAQLNNFILSLDQNLPISSEETTSSYGMLKAFNQKSLLFRTGVSMFDLKVALLHKDEETARQLLTKVNSYLDTLSGKGLIGSIVLPTLPSTANEYQTYSKQLEQIILQTFSDQKKYIYYQFGEWTIMGMYSSIARKSGYLNYQDRLPLIKSTLIADEAPQGLISDINSIETMLEKSSLTSQEFDQLARKYKKIGAFF